MGKFCGKCGRPLSEGELCNCQEARQNGQNTRQAARNIEQPVQNGPTLTKGQPEVGNHSQTQQQSYNYSQPGTVNVTINTAQAGAYISRVFNYIIRAFKSPSETLTQLVKSSDHKVAMGIIAISSLCYALFMSGIFMIYNRSINNIASMAMMSSNSKSSAMASEMAMMKAPALKIFFVSLVLGLAINALFSLALMLYYNLICKYKYTYQNMLCIAAAKAVAVIPFAIAGFLVSFINMSWMIGIYLMGCVLSVIFVVMASKEAMAANSKKVPYVLLFSFATVYIFLMIYTNLGYSLYLPEVFKTALAALDDLGSNTITGYIFGEIFK